MLYQIESVKTKKRKKLVIVYIIALLLVLIVSIFFGITMAKKVAEKKQNTNVSSNVENSKENIKESSTKDKEKFIENISNIYELSEEKIAFLTFDDGPSNSVTPHILDILKKHNIKATFFVLGNRVKQNPDLVKREYEEGHYIANHSYSHKYSKIYESYESVIKEYNKTEKQIQKAINNPDYTSDLFRFPGGSNGGVYDKIKSQVKKKLKKDGIAYLDWNALTNDADGANTKSAIMKNLKRTSKNKNNIVVLMHDAADKKLTYQTLEDVISYLEKQKYQFKNMYDLMT